MAALSIPIPDPRAIRRLSLLASLVRFAVVPVRVAIPEGDAMADVVSMPALI